MERFETATLTWRSIDIETSCKYAHPIEGFCHIEVRCAERLPITETGYKSHFMPMVELEGVESHTTYIAAWLEHAAQSKDWQRYVESRRQGDLFDL